jgi:predicted phosphodiesterase
MKIQALSDIHLDYAENLAWLNNLSRYDYTEDILLLAGDISHDFPLIEKAFIQLKLRFKEVAFIPGNHDLWAIGKNPLTSLEKFARIRELADTYQVRMSWLHLGEVAILPLLSWYDYSFATPTPEAIQSWQDFYACKWPASFSVSDITNYFLSLNEWPTFPSGHSPVPIISFSHFLPRIDLMPDYIPPSKHFIYPFLGCEGLEKQIRKIQPIIHVYGHSHVNLHTTMNGITYINNAFGYPDEKRITAKKLKCIYEA